MLEARTDGERAFSTPAMTADAPAEVIIIRASGSYDGKQGMSLATGVSSRSAGARGLCLHLVTIPPGTRESRDKHDLGSAGGAFSAEPGRDIARPNSAPAYYQGRPVHLWLSAMRPRRSRTASHHVMETVTGCRERTPSEHSFLARAGSKLT